MIDKIKPHVEYTIKLKKENFRFGRIPFEEAMKCFSNGRQCGVMLESDLPHRFSNLTKEDCTQGEGADLLYTEGNESFTVQCKTVRSLNPITGKLKKGAIGKTTKSCLFDKTRGSTLNEADWDNTHNGYFPKYKYFLYIDISFFKEGLLYKVLLVSTNDDLKDHKVIKEQQDDYHYGKSRNKKPHAEYPPSNWRYPLEITKKMWNKLAKNKETLND